MKESKLYTIQNRDYYKGLVFRGKRDWLVRE